MMRIVGRGRDDRGDTLAFLVLWPTLIVAILLLLVHTFIVVNAQAEAEVAASAGLRAAWRSASSSDFRADPNSPGQPYEGVGPHPDVLEMSSAVQDAVAEAAAQGDGWRWWTPGSAEVKSDWCHVWDLPRNSTQNTDDTRPSRGQAGWVQVRVEGEVFGPMAALWPGRLSQVYAVATGPAVLSDSLGQQLDQQGYTLPSETLLAEC